MKESAKRILALVLSFVMIFTSLPTMASAYGENAHIDGKDELQYEDYDYDLADTGEYENYGDLINLFHVTGDTKLEIIKEEWTSSNTNVATVNNYGEVESVMEGETTLTCKATYQKYSYKIQWGSNWNKVGNPETKTYTKTITVVPDFVIELKVGETKEVPAFGSEWLYGWEFINNDVFTSTVNRRGINKRTVTGVKPGTGYFYKRGANDYLYRVDVLSDDEINCGEYEVLPGDTFELTLNNEALKNNDIIGNGQTDVPEIFTKANGNKFEYTVADHAEVGVYYIKMKAKNPKGATYSWKITVKEIEKADLILELEDEDAELIKEDFCEKNTELTDDFKAQILEEVEKKLTNYDLVSIEYDNDGNIVVKADLNRFTVEFVYEQEEVKKFIDVKYGSTLTEENMSVVERYINSIVANLNRNNPNYTYSFEGFDVDVTAAITNDTTVTIIIKKVEKEKISVITAYKFYDEYTKIADVDTEYRYKVNGNEDKYKLPNTSAHFDRAVYGKIENGKLVEQDKDEATNLILVYWSKKADIKFVDVEGNEIKDSVIGLEDFNYDYSVFNGWFWDNKSELSGNEKTDLEQTEKMWKSYAKNISIDDENEYKFKNAKIDSYNEKSKYNYNYPVITLVFEKAIKKPVNVKHVLYFEGQAVKTVSEEVKSVIYNNGEEVSIISNGKVNAAYEKYALTDGYILDKAFSGDDCMTYDFRTNTITYRYWAKRITVAKAGEYNVIEPGYWDMWTWSYVQPKKVTKYFNPMFDREVIYVSYKALDTLDTNKETYASLKLSDGRNIYDGFTSPAGDLYKVNNVSVFLEPNVSPATWEFYKATITLTYVYDKQGNCKDEDVEYIDNEDGKTHKVVCTECEKVLDEKEAHEWNEAHVCKKCGAKDEAWKKSIEVSIELPAGVISYDYETLYNYVLTNAPAKISSKIKGLEEEEIAALAEKGLQVGIVDYEDAEEAIEALHENFDAYVDMPNKDKLKYVVKDVQLESCLDYLYNIDINVNKVAGKFNQIEIKNNLNEKEISDIILSEVRRQNPKISPDYLGLVAVIKDSNVPLDYNNVYDVVVRIGANLEKEYNNNFEFKGKVHLYQGSSKKKKKNTDLPDGLLPQGGAGIADLRTNRPDDMLTRSEFIGVLSEIFTVLDTENYKDFADINGDANELAIKKLSSFGIVQGYCEDTFGPNDFITREQMYTFIARALKFSGKASGLTDEQIDAALAKVLDGVNVADWAEEGVAISIENELVTEDEKAQDTIKRVEAADKLEKFAAILYSSEEKAE